MYFIIVDDVNTRWAYGPCEGGYPSMIDICKYLMTSLRPEIFTIIFFDAAGIQKKIKLVDYMREGIK